MATAAWSRPPSNGYAPAMEPFKNFFNSEVIANAGGHLKRVWPGFDEPGFVSESTDGLDALELKARSNHIAAVLAQHLPDDWSQAVEILVASLGTPHDPDSKEKTPDDGAGITGFMVMAMCETVVLRGMKHHPESMHALHALTQRFSSEFAIRPFLIEHPEATLATLDKWVTDPSLHVRRLVSEGTRPRLPWGIQLRAFVADPTPAIALLERLKDDDSEYVRRSVANHLGDIAKDHPKLAVEVASAWMDLGSRRRVKLVKHGLRWLIKQGDKGALTVLGFGEASVTATLTVNPLSAVVGGALELCAEVTSTATTSQALLIDYAVHHVKSDGKRTPKVFKWKTATPGPDETTSLKKKHSFKPVTTRRYYAGTHAIELLVNGASVALVEFQLSL
ncbi:MAG: 3-methyladenine DNA glycosylase AlkC [Myxococcota bacterium]|jgi:3-methyladenine DNA glycosylase AlkC